MLKKKKQENEEAFKQAESAADEHKATVDEQQNGDEQQNSDEQPAAEAENTLREEISAEEKLQEELKLLNDKYLRLFAEFDNYKRRSARERAELLGTASRNVIVALLPVLDDFDRAQKSMETASDVQALREGIELIISKFRNILSQQGVREMEAVGTPFDADIHEAVSNIPAPSDDMKGKVVDQIEKGYYLNDKVIRFAKVLVGA